ncbi:Malate/L-lactate dehydrogenase [compost metagenome]
MAFLDPPNDPVGEGIGHFLGAMRVDGFRPAQDFKDHLDNWIERFKSAKTIDPEKQVIIPGEPEYNFEIARKKNGIPLIDAVVNDLNELALKLGISGLS